MTIKSKIYTMGAIAFVVFVVIALMNIRTHREVLANLQVRDDVNEKLAGIEEFAKWKNLLIRSISDIVASGHVPSYTKERFYPPSESVGVASDFLVKSGKTLVDLIGKKEHVSGDMENTFSELRVRINDLYYKLDKKIATVLAMAQMDQVLGIDSSKKSSLAPYVLKSLNQLTLVAMNSLIYRDYGEEDKGVVAKNEQFLSSQLQAIDPDGSIASLFKALLAQIEALDATILESNQRFARFKTQIKDARDNFDKAVERTEVDPIVAEAQSEVAQANETLEKTSRRSLITIVIFLFIVPVVVIAVGIFGLNTIIVEPITHLMDAMKNVERGSFDVAAPVKTHDEFGKLGRAFNAMAGEIKRKVTEMWQLNQTLKESESKYRTLVDNLPQRIFLKDRDSVFVSCNRNFANELGIKEEKIAGKTDFEFFPKELAEKYRNDDKRIILTEAPEEIEDLFVKNGKEIVIQTVKTPIRDEKGQVSGVLGIFWDITERKRAEEAVRESRERFKNIFDTVQAGILIIDQESHVISDANLAAVKMIGTPRDELIGHVCHQYICPVEEGYCPVTDESSYENTSEQQIITSDGKRLPVMKTVLPIMLDGRQHLLESFLDMSKLKEAEQEKKQLESQLRQAMKMEAIGTLAGGIAHDFNNILGAIMGYTELGRMEAPEESQLAANLDEVLKAAGRAKNLVQQILTFSRQAEQKLKPVKVSLIVKEALKLLRATLPTTIEIHQDINSEGLVMADPTQIHQVMMNLCTNAGHAMAEKGGVLDVSLGNVELDSEFVSGHSGIQPGPYLQLSVADTGHGMPPEILDRVFDPFYSTKETGEGTGLGLSVVHGIVKSNGGMIYAYSEPGIGSSFKIYLPAIERRLVPEERREKILLKGTEHILFVDDEEALVAIGRQMLESLGYEVSTRISSPEALELFKVDPERFDLVITDQTMPNLTGDALARELIVIRPGIPIILCTGFSTRVTEQKAYEMGIRGFVMKPFIMQDLAETIRSVLDQNHGHKDIV
jgi:PAS domain S-box-containing protein